MPFKVQASPVITATRKGTAYLELVPHGEKVRVQRTPAGRGLNSFWTVWLRQLLLEQTDPKHGFAVELRGSAILVSSNTTQQGLIETVRMFAAQIRPLPNPPIKRQHVSKRYASWSAEVDVSECLQTLHLPGGNELSTSPERLVLRRDLRNPFLISELSLMVEDHVARHLST